ACIRHRIGGRDTEQQSAHEPREHDRARDANADTDQCELCATLHYQVPYVHRTRAERHANTKLPSTLEYAVGCDAVDPDTCEQQAHQSEYSEQSHTQSAVG